MLILTQADTVDAYQPLREDLILTSQASYVLELLDRFTYQDETENSAIFRLLTETLFTPCLESGSVARHPLL